MAFKDFLRKQVEKSPTANAFRKIAGSRDPRLKPIINRLVVESNREKVKGQLEALQQKDPEVYEKALEVLAQEGIDVVGFTGLFCEVVKRVNTPLDEKGELKIKGRPLEKKLKSLVEDIANLPKENQKEAAEAYLSILGKGKTKLLVWVGKLTEKEEKELKLPLWLKLAEAICSNKRYGKEVDEILDGYTTGALLQTVDEVFSKGGSDSRGITGTTHQSINIIAMHLKSSEDPYRLLRTVAPKLSQYGGKSADLKGYIKEVLKG